MRQLSGALLLPALVFFCCGQANKNVDLKYLKGRWHSDVGAMFNTLVIDDSTIFVDNKADTIFTVKYEVVNDFLVMWHPQTGEQFKNKIVLLSTDSLVLDGIADIKGLRSYLRVKKGNR